MIAPGYLKDLTDEELLQYASRIEVVVSLASDVAHEFNDILQALKGHAELALIDTKDTDKIYPNLKKIYEAAQSGVDLTRRLVTLGKPFEREPEKRKVIKDVNKEIEKAIQTIKRAIPARIKIITELNDNISPICIYPYHIEQILINLSLNSIEATANSGNITIRSGNVYLDEKFCSKHKYCTPGEFVYICLLDTGKGIPGPVKGHIFDPFFSTKSKKTKGSMLAVGLGLTIVDRILKTYKGTIVIDSTDKGTRAVVYIPVANKNDYYITDELVSVPEKELKTGKEKLLIVDDNDFARDVVVWMLKRFGYNVSSAWSAAEGIKYYNCEALIPKLAIIDLVMPEVSGKGLLKQIKELNPDHPVIIMTGYDLNYSQREELYECGAAAIIAKPYTTKQLLETVRKVLDGQLKQER